MHKMQELKFSNFRILYPSIAGFSKFKFIIKFRNAIWCFWKQEAAAKSPSRTNNRLNHTSQEKNYFFPRKKFQKIASYTDRLWKRPYRDGEKQVPTITLPLRNKSRERESTNTKPLTEEKPSTKKRQKITSFNRKTSTPQNPHAENAILCQKHTVTHWMKK